MNIDEFVRSKTFKWVLCVLGEIVLLLLAFWLGSAVGFKKANFTVQWGENYERNFGRPGYLPPPGGAFLDPGRDFLNPHGTSGQVLKIDNTTLVIKGENNTEKTILVDDKTTITKQRQTIKASDIKVNDQVMVIGEPDNQGQIQARFIRVF